MSQKLEEKNKSLLSLPRDVVEKITNEVSIIDFVNFCSAHKKLCNQDMYKRRFLKDFKFLVPYLSQEQRENFKKAYLDVFSIYADTSQRIYDKILNMIFGNFRNYLSKNYKPDMFIYLYNLLKNKLFTYIESTDLSESNMMEKIFGYDEYQNFRERFLPEEINFQIPMQNHIGHEIVKLMKNLEDYLGVLKENKKKREKEMMERIMKNISTIKY